MWDESSRRGPLESDRRQGVPLPDAHLALAAGDDGLYLAAGRARLDDFLGDVGSGAQCLQRQPGELRSGVVSLSRHLSDGAAGIHHSRPDGGRQQPPLRLALPYQHRSERHHSPGPARGQLHQSPSAVGHDRHQSAGDLVRHRLRFLLGWRRRDDVQRHAGWWTELRSPQRERQGGRVADLSQSAAANRHNDPEWSLCRLAVLASNHHAAAADQPGRAGSQRHPHPADPAPALGAPHPGRAGSLMSSLEAILRELRKAARRALGARYAAHALVAAVAWVAAVLIVARLVPFERRAEVAALGITVALALAAAAWLIRRPNAALLMAIADIRLGLKERLSTAWERRGESGPLDDAQRRDALQHAAGASLPAAFPVRVNRGEASVVAILAIFAL